MKIVINGRFLNQRITGVQRYAREILAEFDKVIDKNEIEMAIPQDFNNVPEYKNIKIVRVGKLSNQLWEHISLPLYVWKHKGISLNLCNVAPLLDPGIVCLFDAKIKVHPEFFSKKFLLWYNFLFYNATKRAKLILTDSESAKSDLLKYYKYLTEDRVKVIYPSWQHFERINYNEETLSKYELSKNNFFFAMGSMEPNKNFIWIAEAAKSNPNQMFVVAGAINKKVFAEGLGFECPSNMKLLGYISDEEAKTLMRDCRAFLFPTFYEGFGLPPLEAMSAGCKCIIVSDTDVMHEVFGKSVCYINPDRFIKDYKFKNIELTEIDRNSVLSKYNWSESAAKLKMLLVNFGYLREE